MHWIQKLAGAGFSEGDIIRQVDRWKASKSFSTIDAARGPPSEVDIRRALVMIDEQKMGELRIGKKLKRKLEETSDFEDEGDEGRSVRSR